MFILVRFNYAAPSYGIGIKQSGKFYIAGSSFGASANSDLRVSIATNGNDTVTNVNIASGASSIASIYGIM